MHQHGSASQDRAPACLCARTRCRGAHVLGVMSGLAVISSAADTAADVPDRSRHRLHR